MPQRRRKQFLWIKPDRSNQNWTCTIAGIDVKRSVLEGEFPDGLITQELICKVTLDNTSGKFTNKFKASDKIVFNMDFNGGTKKQFEGEIEEIKSVIEGGIIKLKIKGNHNQAHLLDVVVTEEFTDATVSDIRQALLDKYFTVQ